MSQLSICKNHKCYGYYRDNHIHPTATTCRKTNVSVCGFSCRNPITNIPYENIPDCICPDCRQDFFRCFNVRPAGAKGDYVF